MKELLTFLKDHSNEARYLAAVLYDDGSGKLIKAVTGKPLPSIFDGQAQLAQFGSLDELVIETLHYLDYDTEPYRKLLSALNYAEHHGMNYHAGYTCVVLLGSGAGWLHTTGYGYTVAFQSLEQFYEVVKTYDITQFYEREE